MPAMLASAPGKIILFGEHAVVYDRPAIAIPVMQVQAKATVRADPAAPSGRVWIDAPGIDLRATLDDLPDDHPLALAVRGVMKELSAERLPALQLRISSTIPIAAGLGSGAAVSVAVIRALAGFLGRPLDNEQVNALAYRVEQRLHGTPSGIDNTVVTYARPMYFRRSEGFQALEVGMPLTFVIGDSGVKSPTASAVGDVRQAWLQDPPTYERLFDEIAEIVLAARQELKSGSIEGLGVWMDRDHECLCRMQVSSPELDRLVSAARAAGAAGAKLSGGGRGGNMIALTEIDRAESVAEGLCQAGAVHTIITHLAPSGG